MIASKVKLGSSPTYEGQASKGGAELEMVLPSPIIICGDVCVDFFHKPPRIGKKIMYFMYISSIYQNVLNIIIIILLLLLLIMCTWRGGNM